jgi:phenylpropionate dioxygenase-like ring-hydroxylating dioxygenase large terminal subunit
VWVFMGDLPEAARVPIPDLGFMDDPSFRAIRGEWLWDANYERVVENGTDQSHTAFVHQGVFGDPNDAEVGEFEVESGDWWARLSVEQRSPNKPSGGFRLRRRYTDETPPPVFVRTAFHFPAIVMIDLELPRVGRLIIWDTNIPLDDSTTLTKWVALRNFYPTPWADRIAKRMVRKVFEQDDVVVREVRPELIPDGVSAELHLRSDQMSLEFRRVRQQAVDLGYSVLGSAEGEKNARTIIPSPYRTEPGLERAWVFPPTPEGAGAGPG